MYAISGSTPRRAGDPARRRATKVWQRKCWNILPGYTGIMGSYNRFECAGGESEGRIPRPRAKEFD
jgi:hypothetical protein